MIDNAQMRPYEVDPNRMSQGNAEFTISVEHQTIDIHHRDYISVDKTDRMVVVIEGKKELVQPYLDAIYALVEEDV